MTNLFWFTIGLLLVTLGMNGNPGSLLQAAVDPTYLTENI